MAINRLKSLFDEGVFNQLGSKALNGDDLCGVITAFGYVQGEPCYAFSQDINVKSGSLSKAGADKIKRIYDLAAKTGAPVICIYDSLGADLTDGMQALNAYGELMLAVNNLSGVVPQIAVVAGVCASTAAMLAASADFVVMAKDAQMYVAPNAGENSADVCAKNGLAAIVCDTADSAIEAARDLVTKLPINNLSAVPVFEYSASSSALGKTACENALAICDEGSVTELYADCGTASYTAIATISGSTVGIVATNKADSKLTSADCSKIARFVRTCDAFAIPVVTLVDTEGFEANAQTEAIGAIKDMAKLANAYAEATTVKISVVVGKAYGSAFIALAGKGANADVTFAVDSAVIAPMAPLTAVEFFMHDKLSGAADVNAKRNELAAEYAKNEAGADKAAAAGAVDEVISASDVRQSVSDALDMLAGKRVTKLPKKHSNMPL